MPADPRAAAGGLSARILAAAGRAPIEAPNAEAGFARLRALGIEADDATLAETIAACVRAGLLADPIVLADGALHCRWRLLPLRLS